MQINGKIVCLMNRQVPVNLQLILEMLMPLHLEITLMSHAAYSSIIRRYPWLMPMIITLPQRRESRRIRRM